jgi:hypothetical protein
LNNGPTDITIVSVTPVLSETFIERAVNKNTIIPVNKIIPQGNILGVTGEIYLMPKG